MLVFVKIPLFGTDIVDAVIVEWFKNEGDNVYKGENLLEVETTKAVFKVQSSTTGTLLKILNSNGDKVKINSPIAVIGTEENDVFNESDLPIDKNLGNEVENVRYGEKKLRQTTHETENSINKSVRLSPRAKRFLKNTSLFSEQWAISHFLEGVIHETDVSNLIARKPVVCVGAGPGITRAFEIFRRQSKYKVVEILDDNKVYWGKTILGIPVIRGLTNLPTTLENLEVDSIAVSVFSEARIELFEKIKTMVPEVKFLSLVDNRSNISTGAIIEEGVLIEAGAVIGTNAHIGFGSRVNIGALVSHDVYLEPYVHIAPGGMLGGKVYIGKNTLVGIGATINSGIIVGKNCIISNSSSLLNDLEDNLLVAGNPAVVISKSKREYSNIKEK